MSTPELIASAIPTLKVPVFNKRRQWTAKWSTHGLYWDGRPVPVESDMVEESYTISGTVWKRSGWPSGFGGIHGAICIHDPPSIIRSLEAPRYYRRLICAGYVLHLVICRSKNMYSQFEENRRHGARYGYKHDNRNIKYD